MASLATFSSTWIMVQQNEWLFTRLGNWVKHWYEHTHRAKFSRICNWIAFQTQLLQNEETFAEPELKGMQSWEEDLWAFQADLTMGWETVAIGTWVLRQTFLLQVLNVVSPFIPLSVGRQNRHAQNTRHKQWHVFLLMLQIRASHTNLQCSLCQNYSEEAHEWQKKTTTWQHISFFPSSFSCVVLDSWRHTHRAATVFNCVTFAAV